MNVGRLIAISGGIGCGKSVVCHILEAMGYKIYDCDSMAKVIMDRDSKIKEGIAKSIHPDIIKSDGQIDRRLLSEIVFTDYDALERLNGIVHSAVREDIALWVADNDGAVLFVETAILYQSGLDAMVDEVWMIEAPLDLRVDRVKKRNGFSKEEILARISSQEAFLPYTIHSRTHIVVNDETCPLLPQIEKLVFDIV